MMDVSGYCCRNKLVHIYYFSVQIKILAISSLIQINDHSFGESNFRFVVFFELS